MDKIDRYFESHKGIGVLILRIFIGARLFYGVIDNVICWDQMIEFLEFLAAFNFPFPIISAVVSVYLQLICALMILTGYQIRIASILMVFNFIVALAFVHIAHDDSIEQMTPALAMFFGSLTLLFTGRGIKNKQPFKMDF
jgi:putative oxidoreductase